jgi:GntR family transcriptional repressor for pyruvate dehydrogenase complex
VASPSPEILRDSLDLLLRFSGTALLDLVEARRSIEVEIADLAARRATGNDFQAIDACLHEMETKAGEPEGYVDADVRFHAALALAAKNPILQLLLDSIRGAMRENIRVVFRTRPAAVEEALGYHRRIAEAIQRHAPEEARAAMRDHLESVRRDLLPQAGRELTA